MAKSVAIIGGGAAGFFLAINLKELCPGLRVVIMEQGRRVLRKVKVSGGGRCNCTNTFRGAGDLSHVYPRGHRLMRRLFREFGPESAFTWFERHGVALTVQDDQCVFPSSQDSQTIIDCFLSFAHRYGVEVLTGTKVESIDQLSGYDCVCVTTGGYSQGSGVAWLADCGHDIVQPVPSLFSLAVDDAALHDLTGTVVNATAAITGTKFRTSGPLLITHWGMSGPCILPLSSHAARHLADSEYKVEVRVNWCSCNEEEARAELSRLAAGHPAKMLGNASPFGLQQRLWDYLSQKVAGQKRWGELSRKDMNRLVNVITNDAYVTSGRAPFRDEFVTCGGVALSSVVAQTLESRHRPGVYFAGEVLDIDGVTGGFNFQAAWTTAYVVAKSIALTST